MLTLPCPQCDVAMLNSITCLLTCRTHLSCSPPRRSCPRSHRASCNRVCGCDGIRSLARMHWRGLHSPNNRRGVREEEQGNGRAAVVVEASGARFGRANHQRVGVAQGRLCLSHRREWRLLRCSPHRAQATNRRRVPRWTQDDRAQGAPTPCRQAHASLWDELELRRVPYTHPAERASALPTRMRLGCLRVVHEGSNHQGHRQGSFIRSGARQVRVHLFPKDRKRTLQ